MNDIRMWNIREMRICIEWAKTFDVYQRLNLFDQVGTRNFGCWGIEVFILPKNYAVGKLGKSEVVFSQKILEQLQF